MIVYIWLLVSNEIIIPICHKVCDVGLFSTFFFHDCSSCTEPVSCVSNAVPVRHFPHNCSTLFLNGTLCRNVVHVQITTWVLTPPHPHFTHLPSLNTTTPVKCRDSNLLKFAKMLNNIELKNSNIELTIFQCFNSIFLY